MRTMALLACGTLLLTLLAVAPTAEARNLYCTDVRGTNNCPGLVCVDTDLDNSIEREECVVIMCGIAGCCGGPCPPPPADAPVCKSMNVGATPAYVTVEYGTSANCVGASYTTCRLQYYPGEPNTPVWVCTTKTLV